MRMELWFCYSIMLTCCPLCHHTVAVQALLGHQYGAASLPTQVEVSQYQLLLHEGQKAGISTQEVEQIYQRDENSIPASYCLTSPFIVFFPISNVSNIIDSEVFLIYYSWRRRSS